MNVLMFMLAGSDTSRDAHKVLLGILPQLPPAVIDEVRGLALLLMLTAFRLETMHDVLSLAGVA